MSGVDWMNTPLKEFYPRDEIGEVGRTTGQGFSAGLRPTLLAFHWGGGSKGVRKRDVQEAEEPPARSSAERVARAGGCALARSGL
jgi:hypothetical protein